MEKRCIYHYTAPIAEHPGVGSAVRPRMMLQAFQNIGYTVDAVIGYGAERKAKIREIRENIKNGVKYDFVYAESRNIPVALAEEDHVPRHPFMDFSFLSFCKRRGIPIGFFLRDVYWKFPVFKSVILWKRMLETALFSYDVWRYRCLADRFYMPTIRVKDYIFKSENFHIYELPPGANCSDKIIEQRRTRHFQQGSFRIFYVGGVTETYSISAIARAVQENSAVAMTICTPEKNWAHFRELNPEIDCERIQVIHKTSDELEPYYAQSDVAGLYFVPSEYRKMAMPIKLLEYVQYGVPIIANDDTAAADFIKKYDIGWIVEDDTQLQALLERLAEHPEEIKEKTDHVLEAVRENTWECRAEQVRRDLCGT